MKTFLIIALILSIIPLLILYIRVLVFMAKDIAVSLTDDFKEIMEKRKKRRGTQ